MGSVSCSRHAHVRPPPSGEPARCHLVCRGRPWPILTRGQGARGGECVRHPPVVRTHQTTVRHLVPGERDCCGISGLRGLPFRVLPVEASPPLPIPPPRKSTVPTHLHRISPLHLGAAC